MPVRWFATMALMISISVLSAGAQSRTRTIKTNVRFLAASTFVRGNWGSNQDTYLAEMTIPSSQSAPALIRLLDEYPNRFAPLARDVVTSLTGVVLRVQRDSECDLPFARVLLRTAPGDPMAILPTKLTYRPQLPRTPEPNDLLPCYRTVR